MKVALLFTSKKGLETARSSSYECRWEEDEEPPPDWLAECDSDETIRAVQQVLGERYEVFPIESDERAYGRLRRLKPDLVFNIAERLIGPSRESHVPVICEILNIPYTGSDPLTLGICLDKSRAKEILSYHGIATPAFWLVESPQSVPSSIKLPAIVKPLYEGSSKGVRDNCVVKTLGALYERVEEITSLYRQPAIVEHFLGGREFTVGILGNSPNYEILPIVEIDHSRLPEGSSPIYSYEAKWIWDTPGNPLEIFKCPAAVSRELKSQIENLVARTCALLRIRDWCRIDVRLDDQKEPNILEVNPLPGILPNPEENSCLPKAARTAGYSYSELIHRVVKEASKRYALDPTRLRPSARGKMRYSVGRQ